MFSANGYAAEDFYISVIVTCTGNFVSRKFVEVACDVSGGSPIVAIDDETSDVHWSSVPEGAPREFVSVVLAVGSSKAKD